MNHEDAARVLAHHLSQPTATEKLVELPQEVDTYEFNVTTAIDAALADPKVRVVRFVVPQPLHVRRVETLATGYLKNLKKEKVLMVLVQPHPGAIGTTDPAIVGAEVVRLLENRSHQLPKVNEIEPGGSFHKYVLIVLAWMHAQGTLPSGLRRLLPER